ncbi:MAG: hypothetical protein ABL993_05305 [Vicinamibacterales bacterium]
MTDAHGSPAWYFGASEDLVNKRDTEAARALLEETRAEIRAGQQPKGLAEALNAKGARGNGQWVVNRAAQLEWEGVVRTASDDAAAGRTNSPAIARARDLASGLIMEQPSGVDLAARLKPYGASEALTALLAADPQVRAKGREMAWVYLVTGVVVLGGALWYFASTPPGEMPYGSGVFFAVAALLLWRGLGGLSRK